MLATTRPVEYPAQAEVVPSPQTLTGRDARAGRPVSGPEIRLAGELSDEKSNRLRHRSRVCGGRAHGPRSGEGAIATRAPPEPRCPVPTGARLPAAGGRPEGGDPRAVHAPQSGLPRHTAHILG